MTFAPLLKADSICGKEKHDPPHYPAQQRIPIPKWFPLAEGDPVTGVCDAKE